MIIWILFALFVMTLLLKIKIPSYFKATQLGIALFKENILDFRNTFT